MNIIEPGLKEGTTQPREVKLLNEVDLVNIGDKRLKNPIRISQIGLNTTIHTKFPLKQIQQNDQLFTIGEPLSIQGSKPYQHSIDMRIPFKAELEKGIELSNDGRGLFKLEKKGHETLTILDIRDTLQFLKDANAFKGRTITPNRDSESILGMHDKPEQNN